MAVKFVVDSASDILPEEAEALGVVHVPLSVNFGAEHYEDAVELTHQGFYEKLVKASELPTTSQVSPGRFASVFQQLTANGDSVVAVCISSVLSGTYQSACIAAGDFDGKVFVVDSLSACVGEKLLLLRGLELAKQGKSAQEIASTLDAEKSSIRLFASLDTLEYLKKGGRISAATAFAGGLLAIKPVVTVEEGAVIMAGKARGAKNVNALMEKLIAERGGIDFSRPYCVAYSGLDEEVLNKYVAANAALWRTNEHYLPTTTVGCVIGTHVGPGAIVVAFFENK